MLQRKYGVEIVDVKPEFYAKMISGLLDCAPLFDKFDELFIYDTPEQLEAACGQFQVHHVYYEKFNLLHLPAAELVRGDLFEDYAFRTANGNLFVDLAQTAVFALNAAKPEAEPAPAYMQLEEHLIATIAAEGAHCRLIDRQLAELAERIAQAYGCGIVWHA